MSLEETARILRDAGPPGAAELVSETVPGPIGAVYRAADSVIETTRPIQVTWRPEHSLVVRYRVTGLGLLEGERQVVVSIGEIPEGAFVVDGPDGRAAVWVVPHDPWLPGLASALDLGAVNDLLRSLGGLHDAQRARLRSYRPGRRAVVEVVADGSSVYLKVVRPERASDLHQKHRILSAHLPVPDSLGFSPDLGIVAMRALSGRSLRVLMKEGASLLPTPGEIAALIESMPHPPDGANSRSPMARAAQTADLLARLVPDQQDELDTIVSSIGADEVEERVPVHGDFHEAQVLVMGARSLGLIDVDGFGWGRPADDPATMLAHLDLLAPSCRQPGRVIQLARDLKRIWDRVMDPVDLRYRTAAVVLGLATGPFRVQLDNWPHATRSRIDIARKWIDSGRFVVDRPT